MKRAQIIDYVNFSMWGSETIVEFKGSAATYNPF